MNVMDENTMWAGRSRKLRREWFSRYERGVVGGTKKIVVPYVIAESIRDENTRINIEHAMATIEKNSCVLFTPYSGEKCHLTITEGDGCFYRGGYSCLTQISLGVGCGDFGTVLHELLHALGFQHEHQSPGRDYFVRIHKQNIKEGKYDQFEKLAREEYLWNDFPGFDYDSVMIYGSETFSESYEPTITKIDGKLVYRNKDLSEGDKRKLRALKEMDDEIVTGEKQDTLALRRSHFMDDDDNGTCKCS